MEVRSTIQLIFAEHKRRYGYRRVSKELRRRGMLVDHKRVQRLMQEDNLLAIQPKAFVITTDSDHDLEVYLNLASRMKLTGVNQLWVADITYIRLHREWVFLAVILLDAFSRKVVGWELDRTLAARLPIAALEKAIAERKSPPGRCASFRPWRPVRIRCLRCCATETRHDPQHESARESLRQRKLREFHENSEAGGNLCERIPRTWIISVPTSRNLSTVTTTVCGSIRRSATNRWRSSSRMPTPQRLRKARP